MQTASARGAGLKALCSRRSLGAGGTAQVDQLILSLDAGGTVWVDQLECYPILKNTPLTRAHINSVLGHKLPEICHVAFNIAYRKPTEQNNWSAVVVAAVVAILRVGKSTGQCIWFSVVVVAAAAVARRKIHRTRMIATDAAGPGLRCRHQRVRPNRALSLLLLLLLMPYRL